MPHRILLLSQTSFGMLEFSFNPFNCLKAATSPPPSLVYRIIFLPALLPGVELGEAIADDRDGEANDQDTENGAEAPKNLAKSGYWTDITVSHLKQLKVRNRSNSLKLVYFVTFAPPIDNKLHSRAHFFPKSPLSV